MEPTNNSEKALNPEKKREPKVTNDTKDQFLGNILIEDLRAEHIDKIISINGILQDYSRVLPKTTKAKFECPSCGNIISVLQLEEAFREPSRCSCGRRGGFKLISKDLVDFQIIQIKEDPDKIGPDRIKRSINVFLKQHLTNVELEKTLKLGRRINVIGKLVENSSSSTVSSLSVEAMYFSIGNQKGDRELATYLVDYYKISSICAKFLVTLRNNFYNLSKSCMKFGIARKTHYRWLEDDDYKEAYEYIESGKRDFLESEIIKKIKYSGEKVSADMLKFYAKSKMGYVETSKQLTEHSGEIKTPQGINFILQPDPKYEKEKEDRNKLSASADKEGKEEVREPGLPDKKETDDSP